MWQVNTLEGTSMTLWFLSHPLPFCPQIFPPFPCVTDGFCRASVSNAKNVNVLSGYPFLSRPISHFQSQVSICCSKAKPLCLQQVLQKQGCLTDRRRERVLLKHWDESGSGVSRTRLWQRYCALWMRRSALSLIDWGTVVLFHNAG